MCCSSTPFNSQKPKTVCILGCVFSCMYYTYKWEVIIKDNHLWNKLDSWVLTPLTLATGERGIAGEKEWLTKKIESVHIVDNC